MEKPVELEMSNLGEVWVIIGWLMDFEAFK